METPRDNEELLASILEEYADSLISGTPHSQDYYYRKYPELKKDLEEIFESVNFLHKSAQEESRAEAIPERIGKYEILKKIGEGGMGVVYAALDPVTQEQVALKVMRFHPAIDSERSKKRFQAEFKALQKMDHPSVVKFLEAGEDQRIPYYTMKLLEGESLSQVLKSLRKGEGEWDVSRLVGFIIDAAMALDYLHTHGIIHRDIKPSNLFLTAHGIVLTDFGLAKEEGRDITLTVTEEMIGTIKYMSPEQLLGKRLPIDHKTDIYSLGLVLYELVTQSPPFEGISAVHLLRRRIASDPIVPRKVKPEISRDLETIILKAIDRDPDHRYATAKDFGEDLKRFLAYEKIRAKPDPAIRRLRRWVRAHPYLASSFVIILVSGVLQWLLFHYLPLKRDLSKRLNEGLRAYREKDYELAREIFTGLNQSNPSDDTIIRYYWASKLGEYFKEGIADLIKGNLEIAFKLLDRAVDSVPQELRNDVLRTSGGYGLLTLKELPDGSRIRLNRIPLHDFLRDEEKVQESISLTGGLSKELQIGCYKVEVTAPGYRSIDDSYLIILPVNENQYYSDFNRRTIEIKLIHEIDIPDNMAFIPAGDFLIGSMDGEIDEQPRHIAFTGSYLIDKYEVTFGEFNEFLSDGGYLNLEYWTDEAYPHLRTDQEDVYYYRGKRIWHTSLEEIQNESHACSSYNHLDTKGPFDVQVYYTNDSNEIIPLFCEVLSDSQMLGSRLSCDGCLPIALTDFPMVGINWYEAKAYAKYKGNRLPSEKEWEKAAAGIKGYSWPWGHETDDDLVMGHIIVDRLASPANNKYTQIKEDYDGAFQVTSQLLLCLPFPARIIPNEAGKCRTPFGCVHMQGNVWEWVEDCYGSYPNGGILSENQIHQHLHIATKPRIIRGGSIKNSVNQAKAQNRCAETPFECTSYIGFRCVKDI